MTDAVFRYKCRLCNEVYDGEITSEKNALDYLIHAVYNIALGDPLAAFSPPKLIEVHSSCNGPFGGKGGVGVGDLIGYIVR